MAKGYYLVQGDETTCGGRIIEGATDHTMFGKAVARERDKVTCGQHSGTYIIAGGIQNDTIHGRKMAGTLDSNSTCPCNARFIPSMMRDTYEKGGGSSTAATDSAASTSAAQPQVSPACLTGEKPPTEIVSDYPTLKNTHDFPDKKLKAMLRENNQDIMLLTL